MIDLTVIEDRLLRAAKRAKERGIVIPTYAQMKDPGLIPADVKERLASVGLWDVDPLNLFRLNCNVPPSRFGA